MARIHKLKPGDELWEVDKKGYYPVRVLEVNLEQEYVVAIWNLNEKRPMTFGVNQVKKWRRKEPR